VDARTHTPGHQSVRIGDELILGVDVAHYASVLDDERFPAFGDSHEAQSRRLRGCANCAERGSGSSPATIPRCSGPGRFGSDVTVPWCRAQS
jgi:hypothetical protein